MPPLAPVVHRILLEVVEEGHVRRHLPQVQPGVAEPVLAGGLGPHGQELLHSLGGRRAGAGVGGRRAGAGVGGR